MPDHHGEPRSPTAERDARTYEITVCAGCGAQHVETASWDDLCQDCGSRKWEDITVRPADTPRPEEREALRTFARDAENLRDVLKPDTDYQWLVERVDDLAIGLRRAALSDHGSEDG